MCARFCLKPPNEATRERTYQSKQTAQFELSALIIKLNAALTVLLLLLLLLLQPLNWLQFGYKFIYMCERTRGSSLVDLLSQSWSLFAGDKRERANCRPLGLLLAHRRPFNETVECYYCCCLLLMLMMSEPKHRWQQSGRRHRRHTVHSTMEKRSSTNTHTHCYCYCCCQCWRAQFGAAVKFSDNLIAKLKQFHFIGSSSSDFARFFFSFYLCFSFSNCCCCCNSA